MYTYQDLLEVDNYSKDKMEFVRKVISYHCNCDEYKEAVIAQDYFKFKNVTIMEFQKLLYTVTGKAIPDNISANYKLRSNFFSRFVTQEYQYLLSNGVSWNNPDTTDKLGTQKYPFDQQLQFLAEKALVQGVSFGFWNNDHIDVFGFDEFVPLWDEEDGSLKAGIRFWQLDSLKPLRATLYELEGYTEYIWRNGQDGEIVSENKPYKSLVRTSEAEGSEIYDYSNYDGFPVVPLWGNSNHQSELVGLRENIDCYDLIKSGFANTVDEASYIYWAIQGAGGMEDIDLATFVERMKTVHAAIVEDSGARAEAHTIEAPFASREALLTRLRADLYEDAMALDTKNIANGAITATQINAAYDPLDKKVNKFEYCVTEFVNGILALAGIDDKPTYTRSQITNVQEQVQTVLSAGQYLSPSYVTEKVLTILGDGDKAGDMLAEIDANEISLLEVDDEEEAGRSVSGNGTDAVGAGEENQA